jgi:hypothetical protein
MAVTIGNGSRVSLWAMPSRRDVFAATSARLAAAAGLEPVEPHITVGGSFDVDAITFTPFAVTLVGLDDSDARYRCITLTAAPTDELLALRNGARPYEPHLSLLYGELDPVRRRELCGLVDLVLPMTVEIAALALWDISSTDHASWFELRRWT